MKKGQTIYLPNWKQANLVDEETGETESITINQPIKATVYSVDEKAKKAELVFSTGTVIEIEFK